MSGKLAAPVGVIARFTLIEALRNRLLWLVAAALIALLGLAGFTGALAITETREIQSALLGSVLRLFAVFVVSLFVITSVVREFNDKGLELVLSMPIPRAGYVLGKFAGFAIVGALVAALCALVLALFAAPGPLLVWGLSLACELTLVIALSLLCLFTFNQVLPAMTAVAAFYLLARSLTAMRLIADNPLSDPGLVSQQFIHGLIGVLAFVLPELDAFTNAAWLAASTADWALLAPVAGQTLVYILLLAGVALFDFYRKEL